MITTITGVCVVVNSQWIVTDWLLSSANTTIMAASTNATIVLGETLREDALG